MTALGGGVGVGLWVYVKEVLEGAGCDISMLGPEAWLLAAGPILVGLLGKDTKVVRKEVKPEVPKYDR